MKKFHDFISENKNPKASNGWEFSVEEIINILQDFIDDGMELNIYSVRALVDNDNDIAPIGITIIGPKKFNKNIDYNLTKNANRIISRLKEFNFSDIFYDKETHYGTVYMPYTGEYSDNMVKYQNIYINDCVDDKHFTWNKRRNV